MTLYYGFDVSTAVLGMCVLDEDESIRAIEYVVLDGEPDHRRRFLLAHRSVQDFMARTHGGGDLHVAIEQRLKNMVGKTNKDTLLSLAAMNGVVTHGIMAFIGGDGSRVHHPYPVTTKKWSGLNVPKGADKKECVVAFAREVPGFPYEETRSGNPKRGMDDMADAYIAALACLRMDKADSLPDALPGKKEKPADKGPRKARVRKAREK